MDNIIFLDIDGVLNSNFWNNTHQQEISDGTLIDREKVELLADLVAQTQAKLVLHSGWRFWFDENLTPLRTEASVLTGLLKEFGMELFDVTPDHTTDEIRKTKKFSLVKASEILSWLALHKDVKQWVVLDDLYLHNEVISMHQIKTDPSVGLTSRDIDMSVKILNQTHTE